MTELPGHRVCLGRLVSHFGAEFLGIVPVDTLHVCICIVTRRALRTSHNYGDNSTYRGQLPQVPIHKD